MLDTIEIFRPGTHTAENGQAFTFTEADVADIAASYSTSVFAAPLVLGHPKLDDPAWGWVKGLSVSDAGVLVATTEKVAPEFAEGVDAGRYRKVSAAFYAPADERNPTPGKWCLRHVGFLGAKAPAVKGLQAAFAEEQADAISFAEDWQVGYALRTVSSFMRAFRDWFIEKYGLDEADKVFPSWNDQALSDTANQVMNADTSSAVVAYAEYLSSLETTAAAAPAVADLSTDNPALTARQAELDARAAKLDARDAAFAETGRQAARDEDAAFVEDLVAKGKLPPGHKDRVLVLFAQADGDQTVAFAEPSSTARAELRALLGELGVSIQFVEFAARDGFDGNADPAALATRATQMVREANARGETLSYADAVTRVGRT